ncbi:MAG: hypothetical protein WBM07_01275 [Chitinivibrionales bacterium]
MNVAALSSNDAMYNFVKLVDAARQRNISAFDEVATKTRRAQSKSNAAQVSAFQQTFAKNKPSAVSAPSAEYQLPKVTRTKILGNFFDAYA